MARSRHDAAGLEDIKTRESLHIRRIHHLQNEVYRLMFLLESGRPGSDIKLAVALLRAFIHAENLNKADDFYAWLYSVSPVAMKMLEACIQKESVTSNEPQGMASGSIHPNAPDGKV